MTHQAPSEESCSLVRLVCSKKWKEILHCDQSMPVFHDGVKIELSEDRILHLVCQHQAPPLIVELIAKNFPQSISCQDNKGRYPLHIACAKGLKPKAIAFLLKSYPQAAGAQDDSGKTALHYICESYERNYRAIPSNAYLSPKRGLFHIISFLLKEVPELANIEDLEGMNAIEYAIMNDVDIMAIKMMQNSSRESWRALRKEHEEKNHDELSKSFSSLNLSEEDTSKIVNKEWPDNAPSTSNCAANDRRRSSTVAIQVIDDSMLVQQAARSA